MHLRLFTEPNDTGGLDYVVEGDAQLYWWALNATGNARDGFSDNLANATDESGDRLRFEPERPHDGRSQLPGSQTAHLEANPDAGRAARIARTAQLRLDAVNAYVETLPDPDRRAFTAGVAAKLEELGG